MDGHEPTTVNPSPAPAYAAAVQPATGVELDVSVEIDVSAKIDITEDPDGSGDLDVTAELDISVEMDRSAAIDLAGDIDVSVIDAMVSAATDLTVDLKADASHANALDIDIPVFGAPEKQSALEASVTEKPVDGIEILIKLAESGDIDPKNIDIIDVTDKFLKAIAAAPKENLRQSGRIIFHASVLLRMKAEALLAAASAELEVGGDDFIDFDDDLLAMDTDQPRQITLRDLEKALVRRTNNKQNRQRKVTLQQLIDALKDAEKLEKERLEKKPRQRIQTDGYIDVRDVEDILELAHDEDIELTIARVDQLLEESIKVGDALTLLKLITMLGPKSDWVDAFLAILFLSNAGKIILEQEEFYGPVQIIRAEEVAFGQAFKVTGVDHSTPEQIHQEQERAQPPKPRKSRKAQIPIPTDNVNQQ